MESISPVTSDAFEFWKQLKDFAPPQEKKLFVARLIIEWRVLTCFDNKTASGFGNVLLEEAFLQKGSSCSEAVERSPQ